MKIAKTFNHDDKPTERCVNKTMMTRIANDLGLKSEITKAIDLTTTLRYPYIFIDRTATARANKTEVYIDILSDIFVIVRGSMKYYILAENDFKKSFDIVDSELAKLRNHENKNETSSRAKNGPLVDEKEEKHSSRGGKQPGGKAHPGKDAERIGESDSAEQKPDSISARYSRKNSWRDKKEYERRFKRAILKYKVNT